MPSCAPASAASGYAPVARVSAAVPSAGTVVTEMKTPTSAPDFSVVSDSTPAAPASTATTSDQPFGLTMKSVCAPDVAIRSVA